MKKSIFTLGLIVSSLTFVNATEVVNTNPETDDNKIEITNEDDVVYAYTVVTEHKVFNGTADTMQEAKAIIADFDSEIIRTNITPVALDVEDANKVYVWGVSTNYGNASGTTKTKSEALKMVRLMSEGDVLETKIVESFDTTK